MNQLAWSKMTGKMDGIPALNTDTTTNKFCIAKSKDANSICSKCYSWNMLKTFRKNAVPRFQLNSKLLSEKVLDFNLSYIESSAFLIIFICSLPSLLTFDIFLVLL